MYAFTVGVPTADFRKALGNDANYAFGMTTWLPSAALKDKWFGDAADFAKEYKAKYGYSPDYHAASGAADVETYVYAHRKGRVAGSQEGARRHRRERLRQPLCQREIRRRTGRSTCRRSWCRCRMAR